MSYKKAREILVLYDRQVKCNAYLFNEKYFKTFKI